jgi:hypothetical protein
MCGLLYGQTGLDGVDSSRSLACCASSTYRPHVARYHSLLRQLKLELPRAPFDYAYGSTSGALTMAALLSGKSSTEGSPHSTRTSMDDWGWSRQGKFKHSSTRESLDSKVVPHKLTSQAAASPQQLAAAAALLMGPQAEGQVLPLLQQQHQQPAVSKSTLPPAKTYMHQVSNGPTTSSGSTPQVLSGAPSTRVSQDLSRSAVEALLAAPTQANKAAGAAAAPNMRSSDESRTTSCSSSHSGAAASLVSGAIADVSCNGGTSSPDDASTPQPKLTDPGSVDAATGTSTACCDMTGLCLPVS